MTDILKLTIDSKMGDDWGLVVVTTEKSGLGYPEVEATGTGRRRIRPWLAKMWGFRLSAHLPVTGIPSVLPPDELSELGPFRL